MFFACKRNFLFHTTLFLSRLEFSSTQKNLVKKGAGRRNPIINFYLEQLQYFELEIRSLLGRQDSPTFRVAENLRKRGQPKKQMPAPYLSRAV